jgi:site-specific recombinase XerD
MIEDMKMRRLRTNTQLAYLRCARLFAGHFMKSPEEMGEQEVRAFLLYKVEHDRAKPATQALYLGALSFLYRVTLRRPEVVQHIQRPKVQNRLSNILTGTEVEALLAAIAPIKHRAILMLGYGAGLRISETCALRIDDIDGKRRLIHVRDGKGGRARSVMLSDRLLRTLREYYRLERPKGPFLFPGQAKGRPITTNAVRRVLRQAVVKIGLKKRVTPHRLRHAFATHLLEAGTQVRVVQVLLGHATSKSTERYLHVANGFIAKIKSPLDLLGTEEGEVLR